MQPPFQVSVQINTGPRRRFRAKPMAQRTSNGLQVVFDQTGRGYLSGGGGRMSVSFQHALDLFDAIGIVVEEQGFPPPGSAMCSRLSSRSHDCKGPYGNGVFGDRRSFTVGHSPPGSSRRLHKSDTMRGYRRRTFASSTSRTPDTSPPGRGTQRSLSPGLFLGVKPSIVARRTRVQGKSDS